MQVAVERRPGSKVALTISVEPERVEERMEVMFRKHANRVTVPGFRPGKAPRKMLEERINRNVLFQDAVDDLIDETYREALSEQKLEPLERGDIEDLQPGEDHSLTYTVLVSVRPEITLPDYTGLTVRHQATPVTDAQIDAEIEQLRERTSSSTEITEEGIETGDYVTIDYAMTVNGEAYPEGSAEGYPLEVGSDTFFPELNEGLLGLKVGDTKQIATTYPDDYSNKELAGKSASFDITVKQVRRLAKPELNDTWVQTVTGGAMETVAEIRQRIGDNLRQMAERSDRDHVRGELVSQIVDKAELDIPDTLVEEEYNHLMEDFQHRLSHERLDLASYAEMTNTTEEEIRNQQMLMARDVVRRSLVLGEIARRENLGVTDEDIDSVLSMEAVLSSGGEPPKNLQKQVKKLRTDMAKSGQLEHLASRIYNQKILSFLETNSDVKIEGLPEPAAPAAEPATETAETAPEEAEG